MAIAESSGSFGAHADLGALPLTFAGTHAPLNVTAAGVAATLRRRVIAPGMLAGVARAADFLSLIAVSVAILWLYVAPRDAIGSGYLLSSLLLPTAAVVLIGSLGGYAAAGHRRAIPAI